MKLIKQAVKARRWDRAEEGSVRHRVWRVASERRPWWDWGHPVMTLTGRAFCGSYDPPRGRDMWYRPRAGGGFETTYQYKDVAARNDGDWKIFDVQNDGFEIMLGYYPTEPAEQISFYGLNRAEAHLFLRWLLIECKARGEWFGVRRWLYYKALHAAVHRRIPFTCQIRPDRGSGGYDHWHCELPKRHHGKHRFRNYTWLGDGFIVRFDPALAQTG